MGKIEKIILHIGIHKTATTFLQEIVFPKIKSVHFERSSIDIERLARKAKETLLISYESLSGRPWGSVNEGHMMEVEKSIRDIILK
jgi:hypothetical protein